MTTATTITPERALHFLQNNQCGRPLHFPTVVKYAERMRGGQWLYPDAAGINETIKRAADGSLIDGQHRLHAIILSGQTIPQAVVTCPPDLGNMQAKEGCDRCTCGCKYWENDRCIDCGKRVGR